MTTQIHQGRQTVVLSLPGLVIMNIAPTSAQSMLSPPDCQGLYAEDMNKISRDISPDEKQQIWSKEPAGPVEVRRLNQTRRGREIN